MHGKYGRCISLEGRFKGLPLHSACGYGKYDAAKKLFEWDKSTLNFPSVPVILPAFTKTTEPKKLEQVLNTHGSVVTQCHIINPRHMR